MVALADSGPGRLAALGERLGAERRLRRSLGDLRRLPGGRWQTVRVVPALAVGLTARTVGRTSLELHRRRHLRDDDPGRP